MLKILLMALSLGLVACSSPDSSNTSELDDGMASVTVTIPGLSNRSHKSNTAQRAGVPNEVTSLLIEVLDSNNTVLDAAEVIGTEGTVTLTIVAGSHYIIRGSAFAGSELLFRGESAIAELKAGAKSSVALTLDDQVTLSLTALGDMEVGLGQSTVNFNLAGLNDLQINWYVNDVLGGNSTLGIISTQGLYTPPNSLPTDAIIEIKAEPIVAPSFAQTFSFQLLPSTVFNNPPTANAGVDQTVNVGDAVSLSSLSSDVDGSIASSAWVRVSGTFTPVLSNANTATASFVVPNLQYGGSAVFRLTVNDDDGDSASDDVSITVNGTDQPLVANAGVDQTVNENTVVTLNGNGSNDPDNAITSFAWIELSAGGLVLSDSAAQQPTFTAPNVISATQFQLQLTVTNDNGDQAVDTVVIAVNNVDLPLVSNAGVDQVVNENTLVTLDGSASNDPDNAIATYLWQELSAGGIVLSSISAQQPTFTVVDVTSNTQFEFQLTVTNDNGDQATDSVFITINHVDKPLVSDAGVDQVVDENTLVALNGTASNDPDNAITTYLWEELSAGGLVLNDSGAQQPTFTAPNVTSSTVFTFRLTVTNDNALQSMDTVSITVSNVDVLTNKVYFGARSDFGDINLWVSDGTNAGTQEVATVQIENFSLNQNKTIGDFYYFQGNDGVNGRELWRSDGTLLGTEFFQSADDADYVGTPGGAAFSASPSAFSVLGDKLLYRATISSVNGSNHISRYLAFDSLNQTVTTLSTTRVRSLDVDNLGILNNQTYFYDWAALTFETTLYKTDGSNTATTVKTFNTLFAEMTDFTEVNGELYFVFNRRELWKTDGTDAGTIQLKAFSGLIGTNNVNFTGLKGMIAFNNALYFVADDGINGRELWVSDGTAVGTVLLIDLDGTAASTSPTQFHIINDQLVFLSSEGGATSDGIWVSDGTAIGTTRISTTLVNGDISYYDGIGTGRAAFVESLNVLFFTGNDGINGNELWLTDGTALGTKMVKNISSTNSQPIILMPTNGYIVFGAQDDDVRVKLWRSDGTDAGTTLIKDIHPGSFGSSAFFHQGN